MIGGIIFGPVTDYLGRKKAIFICAVGVVFTSILQTASQNVAMFTISRLLVGFFCGSTYICGPAYLAETLPPQWRGVGLGVFMDFYYIGKKYPYSQMQESPLTCLSIRWLDVRWHHLRII